MTLVFDLSHFAEKSYEMSICSLGVMGAEYVRDQILPDIVDVVGDEDITIDNIYAAQTIGNTLDIHLRQKTGFQLPWVTFTQSNPTTMHIKPVEVQLGDYEVILESFDSNGS